MRALFVFLVATLPACGRVSYSDGNAEALSLDAAQSLDAASADAQSLDAGPVDPLDAGFAPPQDAAFDGGEDGGPPPVGACGEIGNVVALDAGTSGVGLVAWYPLDDVTSGVFVDATGNGHNGFCPAGCPSLTTGRLGQAALFDGTGKYIRVCDSIDFHTTGFSVSLWVSARSQPVAFVMKPFGTGASNTWGLHTVNRIAFETASGLISDPTNISLDLWHHVVGTWDGTNKRLYVDGVQVASSAPTVPVNFDTHDILMGIDEDQGMPVIPLTGAIDDVRIYDRAITPANVMGLFLAR